MSIEHARDRDTKIEYTVTWKITIIIITATTICATHTRIPMYDVHTARKKNKSKLLSKYLRFNFDDGEMANAKFIRSRCESS